MGLWPMALIDNTRAYGPAPLKPKKKPLKKALIFAIPFIFPPFSPKPY